jgi:lysophospholipase L1-like esterase
MRVFRRFVVLGIAIVIPILLAEAYVRLFSRHRYFTPHTLRESSLQYVPSCLSRGIFPRKEQQISRSDNVKIHINSQGYRGRDFLPMKSPGTLRISFYGGSSVFDYLATEGKDWPHRIEDILRQKGFLNVEVINAGIPGHTSFDSLERLFSEGHNFRPDYVVLYDAWNDMKYLRLNDPLLRQLGSSEIRRDPLLEYQGALDRLLCNVSQLFVRLRYRYFCYKQNRNVEGIIPSGEYVSKVSEMGLRQYKLTVETFVDLARNIGAVPILMTEVHLVAKNNTESQRRRIHYNQTLLTHAGLVDAYEKMDQILYSVSKDKGVHLIDASKVLTGKDEFLADHVHLTNKGSKAVAEVAANEIAQVLHRRPTRAIVSE